MAIRMARFLSFSDAPRTQKVCRPIGEARADGDYTEAEEAEAEAEEAEGASVSVVAEAAATR